MNNFTYLFMRAIGETLYISLIIFIVFNGYKNSDKTFIKYVLLALSVIIVAGSVMFKIDIIFNIFFLLIFIIMNISLGIKQTFIKLITIFILSTASEVSMIIFLNFNLLSLSQILMSIGLINSFILIIVFKKTNFFKNINNFIKKIESKYKRIFKILNILFITGISITHISKIFVELSEMINGTYLYSTIASLFLFMAIILAFVGMKEYQIKVKEEEKIKIENEKYREKLKHRASYEKVVNEVSDFWHNYNSIIDTISTMIETAPEFKYKNQLKEIVSCKERLEMKNSINIIRVPDQMLSYYLSSKLDKMKEKYKNCSISVETHDTGEFSQEIEDVLLLNKAFDIILNNAFEVASCTKDKNIDISFVFKKESFEIKVINFYEEDELGVIKKANQSNNIGLNSVYINFENANYDLIVDKNKEYNIYEAKIIYQKGAES